MRVAVIGCGRQGTFHLEAYQGIEGVEIAAVCDQDPARAAAAGERFGAVAYSQLRGAARSRRLRSRQRRHDAGDPSRDRRKRAGGWGSRAVREADGHEPRRGAGDGRGRSPKRQDPDAGVQHAPHGLVPFPPSTGGGREVGRPVYTRTWCLDNAVPAWGKHHVRALAGGGVFMADAGHVLDLALWVAGYPTPTTLSASCTRVFPRKRAAAVPPDEAAAFDVEVPRIGPHSLHRRLLDDAGARLGLGCARAELQLRDDGRVRRYPS